MMKNRWGMKEKRILILLGIAGLAVFVAALIKDLFSSGKDIQTEYKRNEVGEGDTEVSLILNAGEDLDSYPYTVKIPELQPTQEEAEEWLDLAAQEIDETIWGSQDADCVTDSLNLQSSYAQGKVAAEWNFTPYGYFDENGELTGGEVPEEGVLICAEARLECGDYKEIYNFSFQLYPVPKTDAEKILAKIDDSIQSQTETGGDTIVLPEEVGGVALQWDGTKEKNAWKILVFEIIIGILLFFSMREREGEAKKKIHRQMLLDYPEIVSQLSILLGSGMTVKQAWNRISTRYCEKKAGKKTKEKAGFEALVKANYEMLDGESERTAIRRFGEEAEVAEYFRLSRILIRNLNKGSKGIGDLLNHESEEAFTMRKNAAKKLGEEAGTKMLLPLMLMLCIVMVIVIAPAIMSFHT